MGDFQANFQRPDTGIQTVEGNVAGARAAQLDRKRQRDQADFEERKRQIHADSQKAASIHSKFAGETLAGTDDQSFKQKTVGLVTAQEFQAAARAAEQPAEDLAEKQESPEERAARLKAEKKARKKKRKEKQKMMATLSFAGQEQEPDETHLRGASSPDDPTISKPNKLTVSSLKDPTVDTSFLPDKARDQHAQSERVRLELEWKARQEAMRREKLEITYSYWDGSGHRRSVTCQKGDTIGDFLEAVRQALCREFRELSNIAADALLYVKEDLILPQDLTFYDLIVTQARGKSGPLFHFDVHEDVRLGPIDARIEKDESHPGKVVERRWYERNKHIFPASRWEVYDPAKDYGGYTIGGSGKK